MSKNLLITSLIFTIIASGCASMPNRTKTILTMVGTGLIVGTIAANRAPVDENPGTIGFLWGGNAAAVAGIISLYVFDEQHRSEVLEKQLSSSQKEVDVLRGEGEGASRAPIFDSETGLERQLPKEYRGLVQPGKWSIYKIDNWISQGENTVVHQDKMVRIIPPQFVSSQPGAQSESENVSQPTIKGEK